MSSRKSYLVSPQAAEHLALTTPAIPAVKQFIRNVRAAKTIADERAVIQKESASIRASFREESGDHSVRCASYSHEHSRNSHTE
jgi:hypothetical protein